jgi:hypothetical protein
MTAPWNVRVTPRYYSTLKKLVLASPDYFLVEIKVNGEWIAAGTAPTGWLAFWQGVAA